MRARFSAQCGGFYIGKRFGALAGLKQGEAIFIGRLFMDDAAAARRGGLAEPVERDFQIGGHAAAKAIGLAKVELRIGIAGERGIEPFGHRALIIPRAPGIHARLHIRGCRRRQGSGHDDGEGRE